MLDINVEISAQNLICLLEEMISNYGAGLVVYPNKNGNLNVYKNEEYIGYIDIGAEEFFMSQHPESLITNG